MLGQHQILTLTDEIDGIIELDLVMAWRVEAPGDRIEIEGDPSSATEIIGGYPGNQGTVRVS